MPQALSSDISTNPYKNDFPLLARYPELAFLDSAATAQRPASVIEAQGNFYCTTNANPLRGLYDLSVRATQCIDEARRAIAHFVGSDNPREIIFTKNASEGLNLIARAFAATVLDNTSEIVISIAEHHSNLIPWQELARTSGAKLVYVYPNERGIITPEELASKLSTRTKIVALTHISNVLGSQNPLETLAPLVHEAGAYLVVDAAQSAPHIPLDVQAIGADFLSFSAHKCLGPFGIGVVWGKLSLLEAARPFLLGGEMISSVTKDAACWAPVPEKFEAGTQDAAGIYATHQAIQYLNTLGFDTIQKREEALVAAAFDALQDLEYVEIIGSPHPEDHHGVISFNVRGIHPHDVSSILDMHNVAIRAGHHCAEPLLDWMGIDSCCRASFAFYNDKSDIDKLINGLTQVWSTFNG